MKLADDVDLHRMAVRTPGFAGADLANVINEAALLAARRGREAITMEELTEAVERAVAGLERKSRVLNEKERRIVAYHEAGHAIVGELVDEANPVQKISIIPRGVAALGYTLNSPAEDRYLATKEELQAQICGLLGGRAAEEIVFGEISTGASGDLARATRVAESMVKEFGMGQALGLVAHREERDPNQVLGMPGRDRAYSEETARRIDEEVAAILDDGYGRAKGILDDHREILERVVQVLFEREIMEGAELRQMLGKADAASARACGPGAGPAGRPAGAQRGGAARTHPGTGHRWPVRRGLSGRGCPPGPPLLPELNRPGPRCAQPSSTAITSSSTEAPRGSSETPTAARAWTPASPSTSAISSEAPSTTWAWPTKPPALATYPVIRTMRTRSRSQPSAASTPRAFRAHCRAASRPASTESPPSPTAPWCVRRPSTIGSWPETKTRPAACEARL